MYPTKFSLLPLVALSACATPPAADAGDAGGSDASALVYRPMRFPENTPRVCRGLGGGSAVVDNFVPPAGCVPSVQFLDTRTLGMPPVARRFVGAAACGRYLEIDPQSNTAARVWSVVPAGSTLRGRFSPFYLRREGGVVERPYDVSFGMNLGGGMRYVLLEFPAETLLLSDGVPPQALPDEEPVGSSVAPGFPSPILVEAAVRQADNTFEIRRRLQTDMGGGGGQGTTPEPLNRSANLVLPAVTQRSATLQSQGLAFANAGELLVCHVADGNVTVTEVQLSRVVNDAVVSTGDPTLDRCSVANIGGSLVVLASSSTSQAYRLYTVDLESFRLALRPFESLPYFSPSEAGFVGRDEGPSLVTLGGSNYRTPVGAVVYVRSMVNGGGSRNLYVAVVNRNLDYETAPILLDTLPADETLTEVATAVSAEGDVAVAYTSSRRFRAFALGCSR